MKRTERFLTNQLIIEGPDLAGKTSFYNRIHQNSGYRWNIQDRSALSMLIYARLYNRDTFVEVERLNTEIKNLNNRYIILMPPWDEVERRYKERGDEIQTITSLKKVYKLFDEAAEEFKIYPNVMVIRDKDTLSYVDPVIKELAGIEISTPNHVAEYVNMFAAASDNLEASHINLTMYDNGNFSSVDSSVLKYKPEKDYYSKIINKTIGKIESELSGKNEYNRKETVNSRRFVYTDDTCISFAQFTVRNNILDAHFVFRSSNSKDTLKYDINFIYYLTSRVYEQLKIDNHNCRIRINFNSAHIII